MRKVEYVIEGDELAEVRAAMDDTSGREDTLWSKDIELGGDLVVELKVCGGGQGADPWVDAVLFERDGDRLHERAVLDVRDTPFGNLEFGDAGVSLSVLEGIAPSPAP